jgi:hypothetical protein
MNSSIKGMGGEILKLRHVCQHPCKLFFWKISFFDKYQYFEKAELIFSVIRINFFGKFFQKKHTPFWGTENRCLASAPHSSKRRKKKLGLYCISTGHVYRACLIFWTSLFHNGYEKVAWNISGKDFQATFSTTFSRSLPKNQSKNFLSILHKMSSFHPTFWKSS